MKTAIDIIDEKVESSYQAVSATYNQVDLRDGLDGQYDGGDYRLHLPKFIAPCFIDYIR